MASLDRRWWFCFLQCRTRGANLTPSFSTHTIENALLVALRPRRTWNHELPILTRISYPFTPRAPPVSPSDWRNLLGRVRAHVAPSGLAGGSQASGRSGRNVGQVCANEATTG